MPSFPSKAMLLAAGLGERLRPLTLTTPKPLIPIGDHLLIEYNLILLKKFGIKKVMINLHYLGDKIKTTLGDGKKYGLKLHYNEEKEILGTGGGIKNVEGFFGNETFIVMNADVLIDVDLKKMWDQHQQNSNTATLVLSPADRKDVKRLVYIDKNKKILSIAEKGPQENSKGYVFTGVQILEPEVLKQLPPHPNPWHRRHGVPLPPGERVSNLKSCIVQDSYIPLLHQKAKLGGFVCDQYFRDLGTPERYEEVKKEFIQAWPYTTLKPEDFTSE